MGKTEGVLAIIAGAGAIYGTPTSVEPSIRLGLRVLGGIAVGYGVYELISSIGFSTEGKVGEAIANTGSVLGRAVGIEPSPGISVYPSDNEEDTRRDFGVAKNVLRVVGGWTSPIDNGTFSLPVFADTFTARALLRNESSNPVRGQVKVRVAAQGLLQAETQQHIQDGPFVTLQPGDTVVADMHLKSVRDWDGDIDLSLLFENYNLAKVSARRNFSVF